MVSGCVSTVAVAPVPQAGRSLSKPRVIDDKGHGCRAMAGPAVVVLGAINTTGDN